MKNPLHKALLYKEWKNTKWVALIMTLSLLYITVLRLQNSLQFYKMNFKSNNDASRYMDYRWFNNELLGNSSGIGIIITLVILVLCTILFISEKSNSTENFLASMPFKKSEIIINKWVVGAFCIIISFVIAYICITVFYFMNTKYIDISLNPYSNVIQWFFVNVLLAMAIFSFIMFIQTVMGNVVASSVVGGIVLLVPFFILDVIGSWLRIAFSPSNYVMERLCKLQYVLNLYSYSNTSVAKQVTVGDGAFYEFHYENYSIKLIVLIVVAILFLYLAYFAYTRRKSEYNNDLIAFKVLQPIFKYGVTICVGLALASFIGFGYMQESLRVFYAVLIIGLVLGHFISKKTLSLFSRNS